jgi:hypothetical protein
MSAVTQRAVPPWSLMLTHQGESRAGVDWQARCDCFALAVNRSVTLAEFVFAFYTTRVFKLERALLHLLAHAPSTDAEAHALAEGTGQEFAMWQVVERTDTQLLVGDRLGRTRSWFAISPIDPQPGERQEAATLLRFGSAIAAVRNAQSGELRVGRGFQLLAGFHVHYSKLLLGAAAAKSARAGR